MCRTGDLQHGRLSIGLLSKISDTDARCQHQGDEAAERRPATRWPTKPVRGRLPRGIVLQLGSLFIDTRDLFIRAGDLFISMREPFIGARDQLYLLRG